MPSPKYCGSRSICCSTLPGFELLLAQPRAALQPRALIQKSRAILQALRESIGIVRINVDHLIAVLRRLRHCGKNGGQETAGDSKFKHAATPSKLLDSRPYEKHPAHSSMAAPPISSHPPGPCRLLSSFSAGSNRPQREPTSVISLTITGAVSMRNQSVHRRLHDHGSARLRHLRRPAASLRSIQSLPPRIRTSPRAASSRSPCSRPLARRSAASPCGGHIDAPRRRAPAAPGSTSSPSFPSPSTATGAPRGMRT